MKPKDAYLQHRRNARGRNIPFLLSFEEWRDLWISSGHWDQRGRKSDQYCMARFGDKGAYEVGNVKICTNKENCRERDMQSPEVQARLSAARIKMWASASPERRARQSAALSRGYSTLSSEAHARRFAALSATATGRRWVTRNGKRTWAYPGDLDYPGA